MTSGDEPQLGGQDHDNAPMISGRGTKIIADARGAYLAGNLQALFDAMNSDQQVMFRQLVVRQMLDLIRDEVEQAIESHPNLSEMLYQLDQWLISPTQENAERMNGPHLYDLRAAERVPPLQFRMQRLVLGAINTHYNAIVRATDAILFVPDDHPRQQPHWSVLYSETHEWIIETGWAILHGRLAPPLSVDDERLEALVEDSERWYRKRKFAILVQLLNAEQRVQLRHAVCRQVMWHINRVPTERWSVDYRQVIERAHKLLDSSARMPGFGGVKQPFKQSGSMSPMNALIGVFEESDFDFGGLEVPYANCALHVIEHVTWKVDGIKPYHTHQAGDQARRWQVEAAWAILHDQPIPPLG